MLDTGAQPNIIKISTLNRTIPIDSKQILKLKGITKNMVKTLGTVHAYLFNTPIIFHVVRDDFPIMQQGILGSSFFTDHHAQIDYGTSCVTWKQHKIPFKTFKNHQLWLFQHEQTSDSEFISLIPKSRLDICRGYVPATGSLPEIASLPVNITKAISG